MIYIHVPYCRSFCTYCDFYSEIPTGGRGEKGRSGQMGVGCSDRGSDERAGDGLGCGARGEDEREMAAFTEAVCREIAARAAEIPWEHNTLYIGGGTPSVLPLSDLRRIVEALAAARAAQTGSCDEEGSCGKAGEGAGVADRGGEGQQRRNVALEFDEFTVEVNPDDIVRGGEKYVAGLRELGVNRVSMGVQSLNDGVLRWMNRRHDAATARRAYRLLHDGGIDNISIDLIFGFGDIAPGAADATPDATPDAAEARRRATAAEELWRQTIDEALNIGGRGAPPKHISAYQLSIEPGSTLADMVAAGRYTEPSDDLCARQYEILCTTLAAAGYHHYEISNFALPGFEARHNSAYWRHTPYIGFGPAAHSLLRLSPSPATDATPALEGVPTSTQGNATDLIRRWNRPDIHAYLHAAQTGDWTSITGSETLTPDQLRTEKIMLALRTDTGLDRALLDGSSTEAALDQLLATGALTLVNDHYRIPEDHLFVSDAIISRLI